MSFTAIGCVEILYPALQFVRGTSLIYFDNIPDVYALLAFPWGVRSESNCLPAPVVPPRGFPPDASLLVLSEVGTFIDDDDEREARTSEKLKLLSTPQGKVYQDPDVRCPTWLTAVDVRLAADTYFERQGHPSYDLVAVAAMMGQYERQELPGGHTKTRLVVWFT